MSNINYLRALHHLDGKKVLAASPERRINTKQFSDYVPTEAREFIEQNIEKIVEGTLITRIESNLTTQDELVWQMADYLDVIIPKEVK